MSDFIWLCDQLPIKFYILSVCSYHYLLIIYIYQTLLLSITKLIVKINAIIEKAQSFLHIDAILHFKESQLYYFWTFTYGYMVYYMDSLEPKKQWDFALFSIVVVAGVCRSWATQPAWQAFRIYLHYYWLLFSSICFCSEVTGSCAAPCLNWSSAPNSNFILVNFRFLGQSWPCIA